MTQRRAKRARPHEPDPVDWELWCEDGRLIVPREAVLPLRCIRCYRRTRRRIHHSCSHKPDWRRWLSWLGPAHQLLDVAGSVGERRDVITLSVCDRHHRQIRAAGRLNLAYGLAFLPTFLLASRFDHSVVLYAISGFFLWVALRHRREMEPVRVLGMDRDYVYLAPPVEFLDGLEEELDAWVDDEGEDDGPE